MRRIPAVLYASVDATYRAPLSIVVPVYQEDPEIFATAIESWLAKHDPSAEIPIIPPDFPATANFAAAPVGVAFDCWPPVFE
jgi:hyaluronan synthase